MTDMVGLVLVKTGVFDDEKNQEIAKYIEEVVGIAQVRYFGKFGDTLVFVKSENASGVEGIARYAGEHFKLNLQVLSLPWKCYFTTTGRHIGML